MNNKREIKVTATVTQEHAAGIDLLARAKGLNRSSLISTMIARELRTGLAQETIRAYGAFMKLMNEME